MFVHLRTHTEFSISDGICRIDDLVKAAAQDQQPAMAITDASNLFGAIKFYKEAQAKGVKPIIGAEVFLEGFEAAGANSSARAQVLARVLLLVQNHQGYLNLSELIARAWTQNVHKDQALVRMDWLQELGEGLILLCGAQAGPVGIALSQGDASRAADVALQLAGCFPHRFYLELQRAGRAQDEQHVNAVVPLAARLGLPVVATHPIQFLNPDDFEAHEARVCIAEGEILGDAKRLRRFGKGQHFVSAADMQARFADLPSALANAVEIARRCSLELVLGKPQLPNFPIPPVNGVVMSVEDYFRHLSHEGLHERLLHLYPNEAERERERPAYVARLEFELGTILKMGFPGYFLIVSDFIQWAKKNGCPVGPGRGSGAGSLVAYALKITDLDPIRYQLLFERFLNPERVSMPDFDIDFCQTNRDRVIDYVKDKYGRQAVSQIATFGTMAARAVVRDVGRVLDLSYTFCDGISKLIPNKPGTHITLAEAVKQEPVLAERLEKEEEVRTLFELAQKLEGLTRNVGMHAGGVLIAPGKLTDFCPLYQQPGSDSAVSQYDKDDVEAAGLVKFDFLGLATLTILELAKDMMLARKPEMAGFDYDQVPFDDDKVYQLFREGKTEAVFQFESRGMQGMLRDAKPTRLEDLIALNALYRPGPMDLIPSFVARKHGREEVLYPHPLVEPVLSETYGIMVYQEQVMQTAQVLGGYSLGGADLLRRAMGKKKPEEMAKHREIFREGAAKNNIAAAQADEIFDLMEKFAGYGFNKSHAAAYSVLAYHTAWVKVHHTAAFYGANMTIEMDNTDKLKVLHADALRFGMAFEPPDVNRGQYRFEPVSDRMIRYGLGAIKGTGEQAIEAIVAARQAGGPFTSLFDFCNRVERTRINKRTVEALIKAGAFDSLQRDRASLLASVGLAFDYAQTQQDNANQVGLFDVFDDAHGSSAQEPELVRASPWGVKERLLQEKTAIGFYLTGHLFDEVEAEVRQFIPKPLSEVSDSKEPQWLAGIVSDMRVINGQRGKVALFKLDDKSDCLEASCDEALAEANKDVLCEDAFVVLQAKVQFDRFSGGLRMSVQRVLDMSAARAHFARYLALDLGEKRPNLQRVLGLYPAKARPVSDADARFASEEDAGPQGMPVRVRLLCGEGDSAAHVTYQLGEAARFEPCDEALAAWRALVGSEAVKVVWR